MQENAARRCPQFRITFLLLIVALVGVFLGGYVVDIDNLEIVETDSWSYRFYMSVLYVPWLVTALTLLRGRGLAAAPIGGAILAATAIGAFVPVTIDPYYLSYVAMAGSLVCLLRMLHTRITLVEGILAAITALYLGLMLRAFYFGIATTLSY